MGRRWFREMHRKSVPHLRLRPYHIPVQLMKDDLVREDEASTSNHAFYQQLCDAVKGMRPCHVFPHTLPLTFMQHIERFRVPLMSLISTLPSTPRIMLPILQHRLRYGCMNARCAIVFLYSLLAQILTTHACKSCSRLVLLIIFHLLSPQEWPGLYALL